MNFCKQCLSLISTNAYSCYYKSLMSPSTPLYKLILRGRSSQTKLVNSDVVCVDNQDSNKKRLRPKRTTSSLMKVGHFKVVAYSTAEEYDLKALREALTKQNLYIPSELTSNEILLNGVGNALHTIARYQVSPENRHFYYFEEGTVVMWNVTAIEQKTIREFLKPFERNSYRTSLIFDEVEHMTYTYNNQSKTSTIQDGVISIGTADKSLESITSDRYALSNAMSLSVKLGVLEAILDDSITDVEYLTEALKLGHPLGLGRNDVLRKCGQLYELRHSINLSTDMLDIPDFYWEREDLEALYKRAGNYFSIARRAKIMNEKLNTCVELMQLVQSLLSDRHHINLEWMIIILICIEVLFELIELSLKFLKH